MCGITLVTGYFRGTVKRVFEKSFTRTDYRRVMRIKNDVDKLYDTDLTDAAWSLIAPISAATKKKILWTKQPIQRK